jgi:hypothetical protein
LAALEALQDIAPFANLVVGSAEPVETLHDRLSSLHP